MRKISFFYKDFGAMSSAVAQRGNFFADAVLQRGAHEGVDLLIYCANLGDIPQQAFIRAQTVFSLNLDKRAGFFARALDELLIGLHVGLWSVFRRSDLFVISTPPYISGLIIAIFQILFRRQFVFDVRDMYPRAYLDAGLIRDGGVIHRSLNALTRFVYDRAALIVCATRGQSHEITRISNRKKPYVIYNGFPESLLDLKKTNTDRFRVVTHGTLGVYQDVEFILNLATALEQDGVEFVIIGQGSKAAMIEQTNSSNISFLGELPFNQVIEQVAACDVGLCVRDNSPQSRYSFPVKAWEYIGLKMPTLIYPRCEVSDVFPELQGLYTFDLLDLAGFRAAILNLKEQKKKKGGNLFLMDDVKINKFTREALAREFADRIYMGGDVDAEN